MNSWSNIHKNCTKFNLTIIDVCYFHFALPVLRFGLLQWAGQNEKEDISSKQDEGNESNTKHSLDEQEANLSDNTASKVKNEEMESVADSYDVTLDIPLDENSMETNTRDNLDEPETSPNDDSICKVFIKVEDELKDHTFEIIPARVRNATNPTVLVDNKFLFYFKGKTARSLAYECSFRMKRKSNCKAKAVLERDASGQLVIVKCATEEAHNHEPAKHGQPDQVIVRKMQIEMVEMMKVGF